MNNEADTKRYFLNEEQKFLMTDEQRMAYLPGAFVLATAALKAVPKMIERFKSGEGLGWHEHDHRLFRGTELFFRPGYAANLINSWIPALDGVKEKLETGGKVADVGCGLGFSTILMTEAFPKSTFVGFDYHDASIETAREKQRKREFPTALVFKLPKRKIIRAAIMISLHSSTACTIWAASARLG